MNAKPLTELNALIELEIEVAMFKIWEQEKADGVTELGFDEWLRSGPKVPKGE